METCEEPRTPEPGDRATRFLELTRTPIGTQFYRFTPTPHGPALFAPYISPRDFAFYFWLAATVLGVVTLAAIGGWHLLKRFRPHAGAAA